MADKRNSAGGGKPGTPRPDGIESLTKAIGAKVRITTTAPHSQTYEGALFTACTTLNIVAVNTNHSSSSQTGDYHLIPISRIDHFKILSAEGDGNIENAPPSIGSIDRRYLQAREEKRIAELKEEQRHRPKGVSAEGQAIYDALRRINMPVRWHPAATTNLEPKQTRQIIVHDAVIIEKPYEVDNCKAGKDKQEVLNRVRKVLEGERRKIRERAGTPVGGRKGG